MLFALIVTWVLTFLTLIYAAVKDISFPYKPKREVTHPWSSFRLLKNSPLKLQILYLAHFFSYGAYLLITVYATSWVGISIAAGAPFAEKFTLQRRVFEQGVSWGAFGMLLSALVSMATALLLPYIRRYVSDGFLWGLAQIIAGIALLTTWRINEFRSVFVVLPLCGFAFATVVHFHNELLLTIKGIYVVTCTVKDEPHSAKDCPALPFHTPHSNSIPYFLRVIKNIPHREELLHVPATNSDPWEEVTTLTSLLAQVAMFSVVPSLFLLRPDSDDNKWGMVTAGLSSLLGSICAFLV